MESLDTLRQSPHWSYSALNCYMQCPQRYCFRYVENAPAERIGSCIPFGKAFHAALTARAVHGRDFSLTEAQEGFAESFRLESKATPELCWKPGEDYDTCVAKGFDMLKVALENWQDDFAVKEVAVPFSLRIPGVGRPLIGEFDLVADDCGSDAVVDWKTASSKWASNRADFELQATAYTYVYAKLNGTNPLFRFDVYTKAKAPTVTSYYTRRTEADFARFERIAAQIDRSVERGCFHPIVSCQNCAECPYRDRCKKVR